MSTKAGAAGASSRRGRRHGVRSTIALVLIGTSVALGTSGCWSLGYSGGVTSSESVNWEWDDPGRR